VRLEVQVKQTFLLFVGSDSLLDGLCLNVAVENFICKTNMTYESLFFEVYLLICNTHWYVGPQRVALHASCVYYDAEHRELQPPVAFISA
jgi:hypothetical protein